MLTDGAGSCLAERPSSSTAQSAGCWCHNLRSAAAISAFWYFDWPVLTRAYSLLLSLNAGDTAGDTAHGSALVSATERGQLVSIRMLLEQPHPISLVGCRVRVGCWWIIRVVASDEWRADGGCVPWPRSTYRIAVLSSCRSLHHR